MGVMIIELVAGRIISKYFGNSLFTWTGVIGIVLGGISAGNYLGGRLADRFAPRKLVFFLLLCSSVLVFCIVLLEVLLGVSMAGSGNSGITVLMVIRSLLLILLLFFLPAAAMGTISPVMAKFALENSGTVGSTVGSIYAISSVGSIAGTFLSGYILIPLIGVRAIVFLVGGMFALLALLMGTKRLIAGVWLSAVLIAFLVWTTLVNTEKTEASAETVLFEKDTHYMHLSVKDTEDRRMLIMDGLIHNMHDRKNPDRLLYDYENLFLSLTEIHLQQNGFGETRTPFSTLTLGGGAMTFPSYLSRNYPWGTHEVVEIDPEVVNIAYTFFDVPKKENLRIHTLDARMVDKAIRDRTFDIVYLDAFNSFSVPYHLTTVEYLKNLRSLMADHAVLLINSIDIFDSGAFLSSYCVTLEQVFRYITVYADADFFPNKRTTFVIAASNTGYGPDVLSDGTGRTIAKRLTSLQLDALKRKCKARPLTDDYAPVENLMAPVFLGSIR